MEPYGYNIPYGYLGTLPDGSEMLFATEEEYKEYLKEVEK